MMVRVSNIRVPLEQDFTDLRGICEKKLRLRPSSVKSVRLSRKSVDARKKNDVHFIISLDIETDNEERLLRNVKGSVRVSEKPYTVQKVNPDSDRPVIVGFGPAGMFAALVLALSGARPIVLERGLDVDSRVEKVEKFRTEGILDTECNVQFGEGGAGTFSDGKLTTGIKDSRIGWVTKKLVEFGAPEEILYLAKPHIGTDKLREVVKRLREFVISLGGEVRFGARFCGFGTENGNISSVSYVSGGEEKTIDTKNVILATGHSARDVFELLYDRGVSLSQKSFSVGVRIEHLRTDIDRAMYGDFAGRKELKAADYKLSVHLPDGRVLYTFCMCPGGYVMAASSENGRLAVNGMSCFARDAENSNSALLVNVDTSDYPDDHPLSGMYFQRELEEKAFIAGGSDYSAPACTVGAFLGVSPAGSFGKVKPSYSPGVRYALPEEYLPDFVCSSLKAGLTEMGRKIKGFDSPEAVLTGIESRSSSPVRINRGEELSSVTVGGLYPCGEGAGYAGGIISAAVDGMKCAEAVISEIIRRNL